MLHFLTSFIRFQIVFSKIFKILKERVKLEVAAREQCEIKIAEYRKENIGLNESLESERETIEAFQVIKIKHLVLEVLN